MATIVPIWRMNDTLFHSLLVLTSLASAGAFYAARAPINLDGVSRNLVGGGKTGNSSLGITTQTNASISNSNLDYWDADVDPLKYEWASSLPLPENCNDPSMAERARRAIEGPDPPALEGRCDVNFDAFDGRVRWLHADPPVLTVDGFLTDDECRDALRLTSESPPQGVGRVIKMHSRVSNSNKASATASTALRLSTTWYARYAAPPLRPVLRGLLDLLPSISLEQVEEVQLVRYEGESQGFGWHEDALDADEATPERGGQRVATVLVYLNECDNGRTVFRDLRGDDGKRLGVSPKRGRALLFFPALTGTTTLSEAAVFADFADPHRRTTFGNVHFDDTRADHRTTHAGEPPTGATNGGQKNIAQLWIHSGAHTPVVFGRMGLNRHSEVVL